MHAVSAEDLRELGEELAKVRPSERYVVVPVEPLRNLMRGYAAAVECASRLAKAIDGAIRERRNP